MPRGALELHLNALDNQICSLLPGTQWGNSSMSVQPTPDVNSAPSQNLQYILEKC